MDNLIHGIDLLDLCVRSTAKLDIRIKDAKIYAAGGSDHSNKCAFFSNTSMLYFVAYHDDLKGHLKGSIRSSYSFFKPFRHDWSKKAKKCSRFDCDPRPF